MNTACLGLRMLLAEMSAAPRIGDWHETVTDVHTACVDTVDILNDLLGYDKMEGGQLTLNPTTEAVVPFVEECVGGFGVHARSKGRVCGAGWAWPLVYGPWGAWCVV